MHEQVIELPLQWKSPQMIFVNSMSDLFHRGVPFTFIRKVFEVMAQAPRHRFQILTKRSQRLLRLSPKLPWPENVWMGVSVEDEQNLFRIEHLRRTGAKTRFLSLEPLLGPIPRVPLKDMDWVIVGGESGPNARPMKASWVTEVRDQCIRAGVPFFFKQWGGYNKKKAGRELEGRIWDQMPKGGCALVETVAI